MGTYPGSFKTSPFELGRVTNTCAGGLLHGTSALMLQILPPSSPADTNRGFAPLSSFPDTEKIVCSLSPTAFSIERLPFPLILTLLLGRSFAEPRLWSLLPPGHNMCRSQISSGTGPRWTQPAVCPPCWTLLSAATPQAARLPPACFPGPHPLGKTSRDLLKQANLEPKANHSVLFACTASPPPRAGFSHLPYLLTDRPGCCA